MNLNNSKKVLLGLLCGLGLSLHGQQKVVFILLDGIPADVVETVATPVLDEIAALGGYTRSYVGGQIGEESETPTISAPGYMSLITGTWSYKHNVWDNEVKNPNYNYWNVFRILKTADPNKTTAVFSTWEDNRTKLIGADNPVAGNVKLDIAIDGFEKDLERFPHDEARHYIFQIDELVSKAAARYIQSDAPDVSWVYLEYPDDMGHAFGDSPQLNEAVTKADAQVGRIWDAVKNRPQNEDWMILITTDHGRKLSDGKGHGGQSARERTTWIVTNQSNLKPRFYNNPAVVDILPSLLDHLSVTPPKEIEAQFDGHSFIQTQ